MVMLYECRDDMFGRYTQNNVRKGATSLKLWNHIYQKLERMFVLDGMKVLDIK